MVSPQEAYKNFLLKVNKNDTNTNIKIPKSQFVLIFNEEKDKWLAEISVKNENSDYIEEIQELLELDEPLTKLTVDDNKVNFQLPERFFKRVGAYSVASKDACKNVNLTVWFIKPKNTNVLLQNADYNPSFEYRETIALLNKDRVSVYKDGFNVDNLYFTYYRTPLDINIAGYKQIDGTPSTNVATDLSDQNVELIIDRAAIAAVRNYQSVEQLQLALQRKAEIETP